MLASKVVGKVPRNLREKIRKFLAKQPHLPYVGPISLWIVLFVFAPLGVILCFSFLTTGAYGGAILPIFTLEHYPRLWRGAYGIILLRTLLFAFGTNIMCLLIGYPMAYCIARRGGRWKTTLLFLVIIPSWTSWLIRLYALRTIAGYAGIINSTLLSLGLISSPLGILFNPYAVMFGLVYAFLPFMVLPIYASLVGLDPSLLEASVDLGATPFRRFLTVTLPLTKGGIFAGTILVFIPALGSWLVPMLLGGAKVMMAGNLVHLQYMTVGNVPMGSSIAVVLVAVVLLIIYLSIKLGGEDALERIL